MSIVLRHATPRGGGGHVQLATLTITPRRAGTLELRLSGSKFVDADGNEVTYRAPTRPCACRSEDRGRYSRRLAAAIRPTGVASSKANGPFDLTHDGVVDHADSSLVALAWTELRQQGIVCGASIDPKLDVNHDGCLDVADAQLIASQFSGPARTGRGRGRHACPGRTVRPGRGHRTPT